jgi:DNA-directed RNA polymerase subunit M/transcription elongation factor TFIIS
MEKGFTKCNRCGRMMIYEKIYYGTEHFWVWKCVYCGEYIDQVILENRQIQKSNREKSAENNEEPKYRSYSDTPSV